MNIQKKPETFESYMNKINENWRNMLPVDTIVQIKKTYDMKNYYVTLLQNITHNSLNFNRSGIDYSNDYEKYNNKLGTAYDELRELTSFLKVSNEITNENIRTM